MAAPELVIADAPYKTYPGGVIAVRCTDWIAAGSGATDEIDALASAGEVVRETQQVNDIVANVSTAYQAADDTLELAGLPLKDGMAYRVYFSYRLEGYVDLTDTAHLTACHNYIWLNAAILGLHGDGINFPETSSYRVSSLLSPRLFYTLGTNGNIIITDPAETIFVRAFSETGSTIEVLLDQIIFLPITFFSQALSGYDGETRDLATPDGADGGDANGEFTRYFGNQDNAKAGDYQVKDDDADAEWMIRETPADFDALYDFNTGNAVHAHLYTTHGVNYVEEKTWTQDTFDNRSTTPDVSDMGLSPEGYGYDIDGTGVPTNGKAWVTGGVNVNRIYSGGGSIQWTVGQGSPSVGPTQNRGLRFRQVPPDQWEWYLNWEWTAGAPGPGTGSRFIFGPQTTASTPPAIRVVLDPNAKTWVLDGGGVDSGSTGSHSISWYGINKPVGVRMEAKRFIFRIRIWDASGAEPSTWDEEFFWRAGGADYDYSDDQTKAYTTHDAFLWFLFRAEVALLGSTVPYDITVHESTVTRDPYGADPTDMTAYLESPESTFIGEIDVPWGAEYMVYWGFRVWTEFDPDNLEHYLSLSMKIWNHDGAPEHQRASLGDMRWLVPTVNIVPMNWRSAARKDTSHRILGGSGG